MKFLNQNRSRNFSPFFKRLIFYLKALADFKLALLHIIQVLFLSRWRYDQKESVWYDYLFQVGIETRFERQVLLLERLKGLARDLTTESGQAYFFNYLISTSVECQNWC